MLSYDAYLNSDDGGKSRMLRALFEQHSAMKETIDYMAAEIDELKGRKGPPIEVVEMGRRAKMPKIIS